MATAFLYNDGSFVFSSGDTADSSKTLVASYTGWDTSKYSNASSVPWYADGNYTKIISVSFSGTVAPVGTSYWFYNCSNMTSFNSTNLDTNKVTSMRDMFCNCYALTSLDVSNFNTSKVTTMRNMFSYCRALTSLDVSNFDTSNVTSMINMFSGCYKLTSLDLINFNTSNVSDMSYMFYESKALTYLDISGFNTSNVTDMSSMFGDCSKLSTIYVSELWNTSAVTDSTDMFSGCSVLIGGNGTIYNSNIVDATYARLDTDGVSGYFTDYLDNNNSPDNVFVKIKDYTLRKIARALRSNGDTNTYLPSEMHSVIHNLVKEANESWSGDLTFSGTYATSTYYTESGCHLAVDKQKGMAFVVIQGGTSTSYEKVYFAATSLPDGVTMLEPPGDTHFGTSGATKRYYTAVLTGITGKINVSVDMSERSATANDAVQCALTVTYA
jgi:surface protein